MLVLDLRWCLFALVVLPIAAVTVGLWLGRRSGPRGLPGWGWLAPGLELAPCGLMLVEGARRCRYANLYAQRLLGLSAQESDLADGEWEKLLQADRKAVRQGDGAPGRYRSVSLSGQNAPEQAGRLIRWWVTRAGRLDLVFLLDVTAQVRAEEAARSLVNDLSHELRTPLATILTHLEVLGLPGVAPETGQQSVALLKAEARRMARLVHQMLELGRLETSAEIEQRPLDLLALAEAAVAQVAPQAEERRIALSLEADTPLPLVRGDEDRLRQALLNLLDNAIKYSRPGDRVAVSLKREAGGVRCAVRDSGPGIPAKHLPHVTRRFYRGACGEVEGSGLGLALVTEILQRHASALRIESRAEGEGTGTCAWFVLAAAEQRPAGAPQPGGERVAGRGE